MSKKLSVKKITFYRWRFLLGYGLLLFSLIAMLTLAAIYAPGGISASEKTSTLISASLRPDQPSSLLITDLPYHALQKISITLFGVNSISIKLPSLLIATAAGVGLIFILRRWLKPSVSVIAGGIAAVSTPFIFLAQQGTPEIMTIFWPICILLLATLSVRQGKVKYLTMPLLGIATGLSLYTPLSIFLIIALLIGSMLHPHVRHLVKKRIPRQLVVVSTILAIATVIPLIYMIYKTPILAIALMISTGSLSFDFIENIKLIALQLFDITGQSTQVTGQLTPFFTLPSLMLTLLGAYRLLKYRHGAQNYLLTTWMTLLLPVVLINPRHPELLFVPFIMFIGIGIDYLLGYWYKLFPLNPYARVFGLIPLVVLIGGIMLSDSSRYFYTYHYNAPLALQSSHDLALIKDAISQAKKQSRTPAIVVSPTDHAFYQLYSDVKDLNLDISQDPKTPTNKNTIIATRDSKQVTSEYIPTQIIADRTAGEHSDRLYIYKNTDK